MCDHDRGPWILWSHCGFAKVDPYMNALVEVACPSRYCTTWVRLDDGKLTEHERAEGGRCPWTGVRVVDDRTDLPGMSDEVIDTDAARCSSEQ
ncbi:hypothetical protein [Nocardia amamiensis]|uniref:hypothetical protein n=1 Tax=Nocardia amamiensis TaxID=404578 RepID=UPI00082B468B|nr:hypothetical protein [Nocardia amamiensis]